MDKAFWQSIMDNKYEIPAGYSVVTLTVELLSYLGLPDPERREGLAYAILDTWIHREIYSHADLRIK